MHSKTHLSFLKCSLSKLPAAIASLILCSAASAQTNCNADISGDGANLEKTDTSGRNPRSVARPEYADALHRIARR